MTPQEFKAARLRFGLTQVGMAALLGYRHGMRVSVMERGAEPVPYQTAMLIRLLLDPTWRPQGWPSPRSCRPCRHRRHRRH